VDEREAGTGDEVAEQAIAQGLRGWRGTFALQRRSTGTGAA
jgi:hypothetical protein